MDISSLIPLADTIPVHWGWFWFFLILTFILHLIVMNTMLGTGIIALFSHITNKDQDLFPTKTISQTLPFLIAFTINTGVAPLLFIQVLYGQFIYTSSILMAVYTLLIAMFLMLAYYGAYIYDFKFDTLNIKTRNLIIAFIVFIFLLIGFFFSNNMTLMLKPEQWIQYFSNSKGTILNLKDPSLIPRYLHVVFASISNAGLFLALIQEKKAGKGDKIALNKKRISMRWFTTAFTLNIIIGAWFFITLPKEMTFLFLGNNGYATLLFIIGIGGTILSLIFGLKHRVIPCTAATLLTLIDMVLIRDLLRSVTIKPYFHIKDLQVVPQYSPMILFLVVLALGLGIIAFMIKQAINAGKEA